jgi:Ca-activated chloride channel family protein
VILIRAHSAPVLIGAVALIGVLAARAAHETSTGSPIRVDSTLVLIPVSVTGPGNRPVTGLASHQFRVFEGKAEQKIVSLFREDAPLSVGIVFDASGSMAGKLAKAREAVREFLKSANPEDEFSLVTFGSTAAVAVPFTGNAGDISARLLFVDSRGRTALLDAISLGLRYMKNARNARRALLVISDGGDNASRYSESEMRPLLQETDVAVYAIGIYAGGSWTLPEEERTGPKLLTRLAEESGGRHFAVERANELPGAAAKIAQELRNRYVLAYRPEGQAAHGNYRRVQVKLVEPRGLHLYWRPGYYAPSR